MGKTILIVDDCSTTRKLVGLCLKKMGCIPIQAENGLDALEKLARGPVDLVITDMNMPQMDGVAFTSSLKQDQALQSIPVLMLSSESSDKERESGLAAGAAAYLTKPVTPERLEQEVRKLLAEST